MESKSCRLKCMLNLFNFITLIYRTDNILNITGVTESHFYEMCVSKALYRCGYSVLVVIIIVHKNFNVFFCF